MFRKATRTGRKVRMAISGVSGSGKTYTALAIASALGNKIAVIDTEKGSASLYSDRFDFDVCELDKFDPASYINAVKEAGRAGYEVIVIDSYSHAWYHLLSMAQGKSFEAWAKINPLERQLLDALLSSPCHLICTLRRASDYVIEDGINKDGRGIKVPKKVGMKSVQRDGLEYEFDVVGEIDIYHNLTITKSRCFELQDKDFLKSDGLDIGEILLNWIQQAPTSAPVFTEGKEQIKATIIGSWRSLEDACRWASSMLPVFEDSDILDLYERCTPDGKGKKASSFYDLVMSVSSQRQQPESW